MTSASVTAGHILQTVTLDDLGHHPVGRRFPVSTVLGYFCPFHTTVWVTYTTTIRISFILWEYVMSQEIISIRTVLVTEEQNSAKYTRFNDTPRFGLQLDCFMTTWVNRVSTHWNVQLVQRYGGTIETSLLTLPLKILFIRKCSRLSIKLLSNYNHQNLPVLTRYWFVTPGWSTSWIAEANNVASTSSSEKIFCEQHVHDRTSFIVNLSRKFNSWCILFYTPIYGQWLNVYLKSFICSFYSKYNSDGDNIQQFSHQRLQIASLTTKSAPWKFTQYDNGSWLYIASRLMLKYK